jgi:hypothetical protein
MKDAISMLIVIAPYKMKEKLVEGLHKADALYLNVIYGEGSLNGSKLAHLFDFISEHQKVVLTGFIHNEKADFIMDLLNNEFEFKERNTGFAFTIPVEKISN